MGPPRHIHLLLGTLVVLGNEACRGCDGTDPKPNSETAAQDSPPTYFKIEPGVAFGEARVGGKRVWLYRPATSLDKPEPLPLVLIGPAGTNLMTGMSLSGGDRPEHLPYVHAGYAVVSYDITGPVDDGMNGAQLKKAVHDFAAADVGVADARAALTFALENLPVDKSRVYAAGHSSAATLALQVAAKDPRIVAVAAFAPVTDVPEELGQAFTGLRSRAPDVAARLEQSSPMNLVAQLRKPVFLFHASTDQNVSVEHSRRLASKLEGFVTYREVQSGDHYDSMIQSGVPEAIRWFGSLKPAP